MDLSPGNRTAPRMFLAGFTIMRHSPKPLSEASTSRVASRFQIKSRQQRPPETTKYLVRPLPLSARMLNVVPSLIRVSEPALGPRVISHFSLGADMARDVAKLSILLITISLISIASQAQNGQRDISAFHLGGSISGSLRTTQGAPVTN